MTSLLKTLNKNANNSQSTKFNPDVPNLYNQVNQVRNTAKYTPTNEGYKTIINEKMPAVVKKSEDLKLQYEKTNEQDTKLAIKKMQELNNERQQEVERLNKQLDHTKKLDELIKVKRKESTVDYQAASHGELKQLRIAQNDKIKKEKEKFNNIIDSLNKIF
jgi:septal ring factor EnvC (AmiA/AmiB activator)